MRAIAEFIMRGRMQATLVVVGSAVLPLLFWLSAAASCLVLLRRGPRDAVGVLAWAMLPALIWWYFDEPNVFLALSGSLGLALVLRAGQSWARVLLVSVAVGLVFGLILGAVFREPIDELVKQLQALMPQMSFYQQFSVEERASLESLIAPMLIGLMAAMLQIASLLCLILGRYWQAMLYNPGGFGDEFRSLRFSPVVAFALLVFMFLGPNLGPGMAMMMPICSVPLAFAGIALLHGLCAQGRIGKFWLVGLYVSLLVFVQLIYSLLVVLAIVDSLIGFRGRQPNKGTGPTNGEG
ncbi:hypothetical protein [Pseudomonas sp. LRF_L74]|uniref:hypothetical protein n=1 Tax=Pseudomonas sp. LRF_L74 TaxID=3369422 RepID=UPI003F639E08